MNHIMADFRQIIWRKFLRNLCKYSTMAQKVLPHNLAWPFLPFLPSCCRPLSTAILCGRKRLMTPKVAPMLKKMILPDNVAPPIFSQIFVGADTKIYDQHIFGWSRHIPTTSFDMPLCMPSCIRHDCLSICLICNVPSCCASHLIDLIERWQPHRSIGAM